MLVKFSEFFISLLIINTSEGIRLNITGNSFTKNKYSDSHVILAYNNVGPLMCISDCMLYKECNAVNFNRHKLECELLTVSYPGDNSVHMDGAYFTELGGWKKDKDGCTPNPCEVGQKCIPAMYNHPICLEFDTPCDVNPCLNNGVCRNKVNDYRCICPDGYSGDHCENTPCTNVNCNYGSCKIDRSTWRCQCPAGYHGTNCRETPCTNVNCNYGGSCVIDGSTWRCQCPAGYHGTYCERDPCYGVSSCNNGYCVVQGSTYICQCHSCWGNHNWYSLCTYYMCG